MIFDSIENRSLYSSISPRIRKALDYLSETDFTVMEQGRYDIDNDNIFALVQKYSSIPGEDGKWECHRKYIDIQYIVEGIETMGFRNINGMENITEYDSEKDIQFLKGEGDYVTVVSGFFGIFFPDDAHMPKLAPHDISGDVKKVVIKIKIT